MIAKLILIALPLLGLGKEIAKHGEQKVKEYNGWIYFISTVILYALYYFAGFFKDFNL